MQNTHSSTDQMERINTFVPNRKELSEYAKERGFTASGFLRHLWLKERNRGTLDKYC